MMTFAFRRLRPARPLCALDLETTGTDPWADRVVEVGIVRVEPDGRETVLRQRVYPGRPVPPAATAIHGLTDTDLQDMPPFRAVAPAVATSLANADLVGFNLPFDLACLTAEFVRAGVPFDLSGRSVVDAYTIFRRHEPRGLAAAVRFYLGRDHTEAHDAAADARAALEVLVAQLDRYPDLPADPAALHRALVEVDVGGRFRRDGDGRIVFGFGKYRGRDLTEVAHDDAAYLSWVLGNVPLLADADALIREALAAVPSPFAWPAVGATAGHRPW
jgi:DNA polymerase III subunit epsilon